MFSNVFVLCTGRCGSTTFTQACQHIQNYTASHESKISVTLAYRSRKFRSNLAEMHSAALKLLRAKLFRRHLLLTT